MAGNVEGDLVGLNTSAGVAQVKLATANSVIRSGRYNPNPDDPTLPFGKLTLSACKQLYVYVKQSKHSIFFAAAVIRGFIDEWRAYVDLSKRPEIIGTLYHLPSRAPHAAPIPDKRGRQIADEFYPLAKQWLSKK
ncbi:DUF1402 family protein [Candidatus Uhrbacteria bacterium]|nr:DUF1402 family protein [Candidatus Uhrbacteria bacterium]